MNKIDALRAELKCHEMVEGTNLKWTDVVRVCGEILPNVEFSGHRANYEFAIHIIEGCPVFRGDKLFMNGEKKTVISKHPACDSLQWMGDSVFGNGPCLLGMPARRWSWLPPKQETVMVELPLETVKFLASFDIHGPDYMSLLSLSCQKALNSI